MRLYFPVPAQAGPEGVVLRSFLRSCRLSTDLMRAVKFQGGGFFADGAPILADRRIMPGQVVSFDLPPEGGGLSAPAGHPLPGGLSGLFRPGAGQAGGQSRSTPTLNYPGGTLANGYAAWRQASGASTVFRPVNRIDKDTSGLVLAAQHPYAAPLLAQHVEKLYYAVVEGELPLGPGVIDAPIGRRPDSIIGRCVTPEGKPSRTEYTIIKAQDGLSLAACVPVTGRTHQIRVHFASIGCPLAGDDLYGGHRDRISRQALHCARQQFQVPAGRAAADGFWFDTPLRLVAVTVESPLPADMIALFS